MIVSLTTIPSRAHELDKTIERVKQICNCPIVLNIPKEYKRFPKDTVTLSKYARQHTIVNICEVDYGPLTKIIPSLELYPEDPVITIDDDCYLHDNTIRSYETLYKATKGAYPLCYRGRQFIYKKPANFRYAYTKLITSEHKTDKSLKFIPVDIITGVWSAMYPPGIFNIERLKQAAETFGFLNDDLVLSGELHLNNITPYVAVTGLKQEPTSAHTIDALWDQNSQTNNNDMIISKYWNVQHIEKQDDNNR